MTRKQAKDILRRGCVRTPHGLFWYAFSVICGKRWKP